MNVLDDYCSVNKRKRGWRVSAEMMFSGRNFGGRVPLRSRDSGPSNRAPYLVTHFRLPKRDSSPAGKLSMKPIEEAGTPAASPKLQLLSPLIY